MNFGEFLIGDFRVRRHGDVRTIYLLGTLANRRKKDRGCQEPPLSRLRRFVCHNLTRCDLGWIRDALTLL